MKHTTQDKINNWFPVGFLIFIVILLLIAILVSCLVDNKETEDIQVVEQAQEDDESYVIEDSILPLEYDLYVTVNNELRNYRLTAEELVYDSKENSYTFTTDLHNTIIFRDGICIIKKYDGRIEIFSEYALSEHIENN